MSEDGDSEKPKGTPSKEAASLKIEVGKRYGYRKQRYAIGQPLRPVLVTKLGPPKSNKYRVRWLDGEYEGLEEWVRRETLLCPWEEAVPFVEDEVRLARAVDASLRAYETEEWQTVREVFWAVDAPFELAMWARYRGVVIVEDFPANVTDFGITPEELLAEPLAFVDRDGMYVAPFSTALKLARNLCGKYPEKIILWFKQRIEALKKAARTGWYIPPYGGRGWDMSVEFAQKELERHQAMLAIVGAWCGQEYVQRFDLLAELREEVTRLRTLFIETLNWMREMAEENKLKWLMSKYISLYEELNGEPPPNVPKRKRARRV